MEWDNTIIPTDTSSENASLSLGDDKFTIEQTLSVEHPREEDCVLVQKWLLCKIQKECENLKRQPSEIPDMVLTIGSLALGAFFSFCLSSSDITSPRWRLWVFVLLLVVGVGALIIAFFMKKGERKDAQKSAEDIEEILNHLSTEDKKE